MGYYMLLSFDDFHVKSKLIKINTEAGLNWMNEQKSDENYPYGTRLTNLSNFRQFL